MGQAGGSDKRTGARPAGRMVWPGRRIRYLGGMAKMSARANLQVIEIGEFITKVARVHGLVEQYAAAKNNVQQYELPAMRAVQQLKMRFMGAGFDSLSQLCGAMETTLRRGGSQATKVRILREGVGSLKFQLELAQRTVKNEDMLAQNKAAEEKAAGADA
jgi:hypothetical protein